MGLDISAVRFLLAARASGVSFERTVTIGRQGLFVEAKTLDAVLPSAGAGHSMTGERLLAENAGFAEPFLRLLGATSVSSLDYSDYQGATHVHDMNAPVPETLRQQFSLVIDGGSLEHIFNFPQAVKNCMELVAPGGHFVCLTVTNNFLGHGFYQFSPELFFRVLSPANGFELRRMVAYEDDYSDVRYYDVSDPAAVGGRVTLVNRYPTMLMVLARRVADVPIFATVPQQSDYVSTWSAFGPSERSADAGAAPRVPKRGIANHVRALVGAVTPDAVKRLYRQRSHGPVAFSPAFFRETAL